ncbi:MAG: hypothetical protein BroJett014_29670 [Planctomycetota bacterium]|nr:hypothetical protein [Planctomycetota bacterium]GIK53994.1 MAG: hypothetical protein BroJett014_29670 [Planctomycetota bacterium]
MLEDERPTQSLVSANLLGYVLGELEPDQQQKLESQLKENPGLRAELEEVRSHLKLHQAVRKVAPRRGSFDRIMRRMSGEGALQGAVPGVHCMLRRAFLLAAAAGILMVVLMALFGDKRYLPVLPKDEVIGQIIYHEASADFGGTVGREIEQGEVLVGTTKNTGVYDAQIWLPTGVSRSYSIIECAPQTEIQFVSSREVKLNRGFMRRLNIAPGALGESAFTVVTPHGRVEVSGAKLSVRVTEAETQVTVGEGSARVIGGDVPQVVPTGHFSVIARDSEATPPQALLQMGLLLYNDPRMTAPVVEVSLHNISPVPARIERVFSRDPVYVLQISRAPDYSGPDSVGERYEALEVNLLGNPLEHMGEVWLKPKEEYRFRIDVSQSLYGRPAAEYWLVVVYKGTLYGPQGAARLDVTSRPLKIDMRNK